MNKAERESRDTLRGFGRTLLERAQDPAWDVADLARLMRTIADLTEAHATTQCGHRPADNQRGNHRARLTR